MLQADAFGMEAHRAWSVHLWYKRLANHPLKVARSHDLSRLARRLMPGESVAAVHTIGVSMKADYRDFVVQHEGLQSGSRC